jgi:hypothetical protein
MTMHALLRSVALSVVLAARVDAQLPTVQAVYDKYAQAVGGRAAWEKVDAQSEKGTVDITFAGISGSYERHSAPERMRMVMDLGMGKVDQGFDGTIGWSMQPMGAAAKMPPDQVASVKENAVMGAQFLDAARFAKASVDATELFDGVQCYKLTVTSKSGQSRVEFFEVATGLRRGTVITSAQGNQQQTMSEYREFEGRKVPTKMTIGTPQGDIVITISTVSFAKQDPAVYAAPPEVKALP